MNKYDAIDKLNNVFSELEQHIKEFCSQLQQTDLLSAAVFSLPEIEKGNENAPISQIEVTPYQDEEALALGLQHFQRLFMHHNEHKTSTKSAVRLPGVLCFQVSGAKYVALNQAIIEINRLKAELEHTITVESGLPPEQRFEFVHDRLHGLITLNAYRSLVLLTNPSSVRFGWANKNIIKNVKAEEILQQLEKSLDAGRSVPPFSREVWADMVSSEMEEIRRLPSYARLKIKRPVKVQPIARVWYSEIQKQVQHPCPMPLIALCTDGTPKIGELADYNVETIQHKHKPKAQPLRLIIERLHLYSDV